jgi:hypothetical protein
MMRTVVMAALVTSLMYVSVGALLALASYALFGVSFRALVTFGDSFNAFVGLVLWWLVGFVPAFVYAEIMLRGTLPN